MARLRIEGTQLEDMSIRKQMPSGPVEGIIYPMLFGEAKGNLMQPRDDEVLINVLLNSRMTKNILPDLS